MKRAGLALLAPAFLGACTVGPDYHGPPAAASDAALQGRFVRATDPAIASAPGLARWWESLSDPLLTRLVDDALAHSPTIDEASARIRQARAKVTQQRAAQFPSGSADAAYLHATLPGLGIGSAQGSSAIEPTESGSASSSLDVYNLGFSASWEIDLFGGIRRGVEQARATVDARVADLADAQVSLSAQTAQAYVSLRDVQERMRLNAASVQLQERQLILNRQRYAGGTASLLDVERLQNQLESTRADTIPLGAQRDEYLDQLAVLTGRTAGSLDEALDTIVPVPLPPPQVAVGDPASLIANRPDIRSAERELAADTAGIGVTKAKEFPSVSFLGILGLGGTKPGDAFDLDKLTTLLAPAISWSFLDFGKSRAATRQSEAERDEAEAKYHQTVLQALQDAETALSRFSNTRMQLGQLDRAEATAAGAARLNSQRVAAGTSTTIAQLDIERQRMSAAIAVAQAKAQLTASYIAVQKALGLGWAPSIEVAQHDRAPR